jgi:hypothetical protein
MSVWISTMTELSMAKRSRAPAMCATAPRVRKATRAFRGVWVIRAATVHLAIQAMMAYRAKKAFRVIRVRRVIPGQKAIQVPRVIQVPRAIPDQKVILDRRDPRAMVVLKGLLVHRARWARPVPMAFRR